MGALTVEMLAAEPRWERARLAALPGRCRGDLLGPWGQNLAKRFGADAVTRVRARLPAPLAQVGAVLSSDDWVPVYTQVAVTEAIVDEFLGGDFVALYPLLIEDTRASLNRVYRLLARSLGVGRAIKIVPKPFRKVYERGTAEVAVDGRTARLSFGGNALFANPTWRVLQLYAVRTLFDLTGNTGSSAGENTGLDSFAVLVTW
jgi:hypothetical protein